MITLASREARRYIEKEIRGYHKTKGMIESANIDNFNKLQHMKMFINSFNYVYEQLPEHKKGMVHLMYWDKRDMNCDRIGMELYVDGSTVGRWRNRILDEVAEIMGLK